MPNYLRRYLPGGTWFFTVNLADRRSALLVDRYEDLCRIILSVKRRNPFRIEAQVVLPDHLHAMWSLPEGDTDFSGRWRAIKKQFTRQFPAPEPRTESQLRRGERSIWQARFWEHLIRDDADFITHLDYCYWNPVKHGYTREMQDWRYSTYHRDVRCGRYPGPFNLDFDNTISFGEPAMTGEEADDASLIRPTDKRPWVGEATEADDAR